MSGYMKLHSLTLFMALLFCSTLLWGQEKSGKKNLVERFFDRLAVSKADSTYAVRNSYRFIVKPKLGTSFGYINFRWKEDETKRNYDIRSEPIWKIGMNIGYRNLSVGFQSNVSRIFGGSKSEDSEYAASLYGVMLGGDFSYNVSSRYTIVNRDEQEWGEEVEYVQTKRLQANGYYVFNHRHFSYPAVFTQSYRQKKSCGSFIAGLSLNFEVLEFDETKLFQEFSGRLGENDYVKKINYGSYNLNVGYAYNWVLGKHWLLHGSLIPSFSLYEKSNMEFADRTERLKVNKFNVGCIVRIGVLWDGVKHFGGFTAVMNVNSLGYSPVNITDFYVRTRMFYGFRF